MKLLVITGLSGAGKSQALQIAEDMGYYCVDNLPPMLMVKFTELVRGAGLSLVALVLDVRSRQFFSQVGQAMADLEDLVEEMTILYLEAGEDTLIKRYKELRRPHPLSSSISLGIQEEKKLLADLRGRSDYIIDTSQLNNHQLKSKLKTLLAPKESQEVTLSVVSFGYKYGVLQDGDLIFDVRFLPNPYYVNELKKKDGTHRETAHYVLKSQAAQGFLDRVEDLLSYLVPYYQKEGRDLLVIGVGCTGGFHRSVALAGALYDRLREKNFHVLLSHRDLGGDRE
ncbi:MAG: RNase adapter RapZ [Tissierellia bacterium]|nr:RNase adapter RapZ [Tissierellia bacterium]